MLRAAVVSILVIISGCDDRGSESPDGSASCEGFDPAKGGLDPCTNECRRPVTGYVCAIGMGMDRCPADDGANECDCYRGPNWVCTQVAPWRDDGGMPIGPAGRPIDAPAWPFCRTDADCGDSHHPCKFDPDPRETLGRCDNTIL
jgi:hypothetical protein